MVLAKHHASVSPAEILFKAGGLNIACVESEREEQEEDGERRRREHESEHESDGGAERRVAQASAQRASG